jgi:hypothetical protein
MARTIILKSGGATSTFGFQRVDRTKLYGVRRRIAMDPDGNICERAALTDDGALLLRKGMTAQGYFDSGGRWIASRDLVGLDDQGQALEPVPSTLGVAQELQGPLPPQELLDLQVNAVYALDEQEVDPGLKQALEQGKIFRFPFNYRSDFRAEVAFLMANDSGVFALVGQPAEPLWCELEIAAADLDEDGEDDLDGDFDFEMF